MTVMRGRFTRMVVTLLCGAMLAACADKPFQPNAATGSRKMQLQISAQGITASASKKILIAVVAYATNAPAHDSSKVDSLQFIAGPVVAQVTGGTQTVAVNVDLTACLADKLRHGSQTACSIYYGIFLRDSAGFNSDSGHFESQVYDYVYNGPVDVSPGTPPTLAPINLSVTRFAVNHFEDDEALRLGGQFTPNGFSGAIGGAMTGVAPGTAPPIYALTNGFTSTGSNGSGFSSAQLAILQNGSWQIVPAPQTAVRFTDVAAYSTTDVYLAATDGLYHYDGTAITAVAAVRDNLSSIGLVGSGASRYIVIGTQTGSVWFGNGTTFQKSAMPGGVTSVIDGACVTGPNEAFASSSQSGGLFRFDGTNWSSIPAGVLGAKQDLQCAGPGQAFVSMSNGVMLKWLGTTWAQLPALPNSRANYRLGVVSPTELYATGDSAAQNRAFYRFDGVSWTQVGKMLYQQPINSRPWADPRGGVVYFASSFARIERATPSGAQVINYSPSVRDLIMTSATSAFAVGWNLFLARWDGSIWHIDAPPVTQTIRILTGVWSDGPSNAWVVGNSSTVLHWDGTKWNVISDNLHPIAAFDSYNAVWGNGGSVWAVGNNSILRCRSTISCTLDQVSGIDSLFGVWGVSATNAFAVGAHGKILHFDGNAWTPMTSPTPNKLVRAWGSGPSDVWAVGDSAIIHYDGTAWTNAVNESEIVGNGPPLTGPSQPSFQVGLWGTGPKEVYLGTYYGQIYRYDGSQWNQVSSASGQLGGGRVVAISGFTGGCALALIDGASSGPGGPTLMRGVGPSGCLSAPMTPAPASSWP